MSFLLWAYTMMFNPPKLRPKRPSFGTKEDAMKFTEKMDDKADRKAGIKENSKKDMGIDKKRGLNEDKGKMPMKGPMPMKGKMPMPMGGKKGGSNGC
jgi:hypothetical protein